MRTIKKLNSVRSGVDTEVDRMHVKKVTLDDLEAIYCCMSELPPDVSWAEALPESREWFKANIGKHVEGYHLLDGDKVVGHIYYETSETALVPYEIEPKIACIYCTEMLLKTR